MKWGEYMAFSDQLKKARLKMNYKQKQIADLMGITKSTYCGYENGQRQPNLAKVKQLSNILHISGDILLETGYEHETERIEIDDETLRLTQQYNLLSESDRDLIKKIIESLAAKSISH